MTDRLTRSYGSRIVINLDTRRLSHFEGNQPVKTYPVGVGKQATPTPTGSYQVVEKVMHPGGMLGTRWMGLSIPGGNYGIHGTNNPSSIGGYVSNGCIRMHNQDVEELFSKVGIGMPVEIVLVTHVQDHLPADGHSGTKTHIVQQGENLWEIARKYGKDLNSIIQVNNISNPDLLYPGQTIIIPA